MKSSRHGGASSAGDKDDAEVQRKRFEQEVLKELCTCNGLTYGRLQQEGPGLRILEMFFSGYPKMVGLNFFPNLQVLCIMGQTVTHIENLVYCPHLKECWIAECHIKKIDGLETCHTLKRLFLYGNDIEKIDNLDHLIDLQVLWLNSNKIKNIEGLSHLKYLRELNLADNQIETLGHSLDSLQYLEKLELSGNQLCSFKDVTNLGRVMGLLDLGIKSALYEPNPIGQLCNYSTHMLYHLPQLRILDLQDVSLKALKDTAESTVLKKKMFYRMRLRSLQRDLCQQLSSMQQAKSRLLFTPHQRIRDLMYAIKEIELDMGDWPKNEITSDDLEIKDERKYISQMQLKKRMMDERVNKWHKKCREFEQYYEEAAEKVKQVMEMQNQRLVAELESGGNIRYEHGKTSDAWFAACHDLVLSRFCATDFKEHSVTGLKILRITRIHNRLLKLRFEKTMAGMVEDEDEAVNTATSSVTSTTTAAGYSSTQPTNSNPNLVSTRTPSYRKLLEYLFWVWDPEIPGGLNEPARVLQEGFMEPDLYKKLGKDAAVPLSNSISSADKPRMNYMTKQAKGKDTSDPCPYRTGQIVVAKVFLGKTQQCTTTTLIEKSAFPKIDTVYRPRNDPGDKPGSSSCGSELGARCECASRQCDWFVFNSDLAIPEYVVEFQYLTKCQPRSPFAQSAETLLGDTKNTVVVPDFDADDDVHSMEPATKPRPRLVTLTEEILLKQCQAEALHDIVVLNLHGNGLTRLKPVQCLSSLKTLIISFNEVTKLDEISNMNIEYLDASFNKIHSLDGIKNLNRLEHLDISWNQLFNTRDDISILRKHTPALKVLDLRHNNWQKPEGLRLRAIGRIKSLTLLDGQTVTENEATAALRMAAGSRISQVSLMAHSRTDVQEPRTLILEPVSQVLGRTSRYKPDRIGEADNHWYSQVTSLNLDSQHISKLSNLDRLENLRWASFNDNDITKIEGLDSCVHLEELSLDKNCISRLEGLGRLTKLRWLSVSQNYLTSVDGGCLDHQNQLDYLGLENNQITTLSGLQRLPALSELYVSNNCIDNIREVFCLKNLGNLLILDLHGNPVTTSMENYRLFIIYHLKTLKALDGTPIEFPEGSQARDMFGGRLTPDFVAERLGHANFSDVRELDFPQCNIRTVDLGNSKTFLNLRSLNLENNNLTSFSGLVHLVHLRVLCLNHNHVECISGRPRPAPAPAKSRLPAGATVSERAQATQVAEPYPADVDIPLMENLEVLHLAYNGIKDMAALQLSRLPNLKALFLQGNEITRIEGLEGLNDLRELVLDRNKVKGIGEYSLANQYNLQELHVEENRIKELSNLSHLENLQRLFLGMNRIQDILELEKLEQLPNLIELSVVGNAVARRLLHRPMLVYRMPNLVVIDGIPVTDEESHKAQLYFLEQLPPQQMLTTIESTLPGIGQYKTQIPVKVTNMQLMSGPFITYNDRLFSGTMNINDEILQYEIQKGRSKKGGSKETAGSPSQLAGRNPGPAPFMYHHSQANSLLGSRSQQQLGNQVPYVPHQQYPDYQKHTDSLTKISKGNSRR